VAGLSVLVKHDRAPSGCARMDVSVSGD
jgi:hypothetical protein